MATKSYTLVEELGMHSLYILTVFELCNNIIYAYNVLFYTIRKAQSQLHKAENFTRNDTMDKLEMHCHFREHTCEVLFEQDNEETSVATLILDSILKVRLSTLQCLIDHVQRLWQLVKC